MVQMLDRKSALIYHADPLPPMASAKEILADALPLLQPVSRMSVTEAAERYIRVQTGGVWQQFDRNDVPYMVEPSDMTQSRLYRSVAIVGPAQSGKTFFLITTAMHAVKCDPGPVQIIHMSKTDGDAWVEESLNPTIQNSPGIYENLGRGADDDTFSRKRFKGMRLAIGYPVAKQLSGRKQLKVLLTDYDHMPQQLGPKDQPEGSPHSMSLQRIKSFLSRGTVAVEGTPAYAVVDTAWSPSAKAPHEMPPVSAGIVQIYNRGTRGRWMWECRDCRSLFEPRFELLEYDRSLDPMAAGESAVMVCPHCGGFFNHSHKRENNRRALKGHGGWLHEGRDGQLVQIGDSGIRSTDTVSYAINGAAATFANWTNLVSNFETARRQFEDDGDELALRQFYFTDIGVPFKSEHGAKEGELTLAALKEDRLSLEKGVAPEWARFITISVDVQGSYFPVQVEAWGEDQRRTVIDRFDLTQPPDGEERKLAPHKYVRDWDVLIDLEQRIYPVESADYGLKACALAVDFQGLPGVSDHAEAFIRARGKEGQSRRWFTSRGHGGLGQRDRVWYEAPERASGGGKARAIKLLNMAVDRLKDTVFAALNKPAGAAGCFQLCGWMKDDPINEFIAEERTEKGWSLRAGRKRNESFDLSVQATAMAEHKGVKRVNWSAPPSWAVGGQTNEFAFSNSAIADEKPVSKASSTKSSDQWIKPRSDWI